MAAKILVKMRYKKGKTKGFYALLKKFRSDAMDQMGYISGEHLISRDDPQRLISITLWQKVEYWLKWKENPARKALEQQIQQCLEEPIDYEVYNLGTFLHGDEMKAEK